MSNARYFADGVDFWRVKYDSGNTEGPYTSPVSARKVGNQAIRVRQHWSYGGVTPPVLLNEWQDETGFRLQKLVAVARPIRVEYDPSDPLPIVSSRELYLDWEDWNA